MKKVTQTTGTSATAASNFQTDTCDFAELQHNEEIITQATEEINHGRS